MSDVAYFLVQCVEISLLKAHWRELLTFYFQRLKSHNPSLDYSEEDMMESFQVSLLDIARLYFSYIYGKSFTPEVF